MISATGWGMGRRGETATVLSVGIPSFNTLLIEAGLEVSGMSLVRHQEVASRTRLTPYVLWCRNDGSFERYQAIQRPNAFGAAKILATFVVSQRRDTVFAGLYSVDSHYINDRSQHCPLRNADTPAGLSTYTLGLMPHLETLRGRLIIDWGPATRTWIQIAERQNKSIVAIERANVEPPFPGFDRFSGETDGLRAIPHSWQTALAAVRGVYLLVCMRTGQQYVGSATSAGGFWERWQAYADGGDGGNVMLKASVPSNYTISILEIAPLMATNEAILTLESLWKRKLGSRAHGLNAN